MCNNKYPTIWFSVALRHNQPQLSSDYTSGVANRFTQFDNYWEVLLWATFERYCCFLGIVKYQYEGCTLLCYNNPSLGWFSITCM